MDGTKRLTLLRIRAQGNYGLRYCEPIIVDYVFIYLVVYCNWEKGSDIYLTTLW